MGDADKLLSRGSNMRMYMWLVPLNVLFNVDGHQGLDHKHEEYTSEDTVDPFLLLLHATPRERNM